MSEEDKVFDDGSANAGSPNDISGGPSDDGESPEGKTDDATEESSISKKEYEEAQRLIGQQGKELGDLRNFFNELSPLLDKLQAQPEIIEAVLDGKLDSDLAKAVLDNKVSIKDAEQVSDAHSEVKKDMGNKEYAAASPEEIEKLVMEKIEEKTSGLQKNISEIEEKRAFESSIQKFIENAPDFDRYAEDISKWLEEHPDQYDISVAYEAVKGREVLMQAKKSADTRAAEEAKKVAANAAGGSGSRAGVIDDKNIVDELIAPSSDANMF